MYTPRIDKNNKVPAVRHAASEGESVQPHTLVNRTIGDGQIKLPSAWNRVRVRPCAHAVAGGGARQFCSARPLRRWFCGAGDEGDARSG